MGWRIRKRDYFNGGRIRLHVNCRYGNFYGCPNKRKGIEGLVASCGVNLSHIAGVAQLVEHLICNQRVGGSNPFASSR